MTKWQEVKLGDVCKFQNGKKRPLEKGTYPVYGGNGVIDYANQFNIENCVIVGRVGAYCGSVFLSKGRCWVSDNAISGVSTQKTAVFYLYYLLKSLKLNARHIGSGQPLITQDILNSISILLPPLEIQKKIAGVLGALDDKIELNQRQNNNLEQQAQAVFLKTINSNNFDNKLLSEVATIKYGKGLPTNKLTKVGYKVFGGNGIIGYYTEYLYKEPQILISCRGAASGTILESHPYSYITNNSLIVELNDRRYYEFLKQYFSLNQLHSYATGSAQPQITIDNLKTVEVPYPNYEVISDINAYFTSISDKIYENICENEKLAAIRDALLPKLMSGEIDVSNVDISALTSTDKLSFSEKE